MKTLCAVITANCGLIIQRYPAVSSNRKIGHTRASAQGAPGSTREGAGVVWDQAGLVESGKVIHPTIWDVWLPWGLMRPMINPTQNFLIHYFRSSIVVIEETQLG